jgi:hypothetical protein
MEKGRSPRYVFCQKIETHCDMARWGENLKKDGQYRCENWLCPICWRFKPRIDVYGRKGGRWPMKNMK